jgi:hypothetical protein
VATLPTPEYRPLLQILADHRVDFLVVGGVAAVLHGAPIMTFDLDVVHSRNPANVGRLLTALASLDAHARGRPTLRPDATHLASPGHQLLMTRFGPLDVLGSVGAKRSYEDLVPFALPMALTPTLTVRVLRLDWLIRLKEETGGEKDRAVLPILRRTLEQKS